MPDKHNPRDWSADDTFWNEAWHDMQTRLDASAQRPDRRPLLLVLLLLFLVGAGTLVLRPWEGQSPSEEPPMLADAAAAGAPGTEVYEPPTAPPDKALPNTELDNELADSPLPTSSSRTVPATINSSVVAGSVLPRSTALPELVAPARPAQNVVSMLYREVPPVVYGMRLNLRVIAQPPVEAPLEVTKAPHWWVELGANNSTGNWKPGYYAQLGYRLGTGKTFVPLVLRYTRTHRNLTQGAGAGAAQSLEALFDQQINLSNLSSVADRLDRGGYYYMTASALELRSGVGRQLGRFTLMGGLELQYLLSGVGPAFRNSDSSTPTLVYGAAEPLNFGGANLSVASSNRNDELLVNNRVRRWNTGAWLRLDYRLLQRLDVSAGVDHLLGSPYTDSVLDVTRSRFDFGLGYRF